MNRLFMISISSLTAMLFITACGASTTSDSPEEEIIDHSEEEETDGDKQNDKTTDQDVSEDLVDNETEKEKAGSETSGEKDSQPSKKKDIPVKVEGEVEMRPAQFHRSGLGYSIYVLDDYTLASEEPNRDVILANYDQSFFTRVIVHGEGADPLQLKENHISNKTAEIQEVEVPLEDVEFSLFEEVESEDGKTAIYYVAKKYNDTLIEFTLFLPVEEAIEGIEPSMWSMISTIGF
ncbi:hypothetical protein [Bacillus suaedae]|uniref:Lipoprotein n=1 Tax=Halalkalibacter suaedae TaxID=2822140 RepID=A0A940X1C2_9BACI|nr:hypothetical protein [Bacillus suaedae]MBP3952974.1 hypothetical protein [Bacillus suaedae]